MGKKKIIDETDVAKKAPASSADKPAKAATAPSAPADKAAVVAAPVVKTSRARFTSGIMHVHATYNNTKVLFTDNQGNAVAASSSGALGFTGAKKGTPFAAAKAAEIVADKIINMGVRELDVIITGVGAGRESAIRTCSSKGLIINSIKDTTPVPHNGPKPKKPRRV